MDKTEYMAARAKAAASAVALAASNKSGPSAEPLEADMYYYGGISNADDLTSNTDDNINNSSQTVNEHLRYLYEMNRSIGQPWYSLCILLYTICVVTAITGNYPINYLITPYGYLLSI